MQKSEPSPAAGGNGSGADAGETVVIFHQDDDETSYLPHDPAFHPGCARKHSWARPLALEPPHAGVPGREGTSPHLSPPVITPEQRGRRAVACRRPHLASRSSPESLPLERTTNEGKLLRRPAWGSEPRYSQGGGQPGSAGKAGGCSDHGQAPPSLLQGGRRISSCSARPVVKGHLVSYVSADSLDCDPADLCREGAQTGPPPWGHAWGRSGHALPSPLRACLRRILLGRPPFVRAATPQPSWKMACS